MVSEDFAKFEHLLKQLSGYGEDEIDLVELHDRAVECDLYKTFVAELKKVDHLFYLNPDVVICQEMVYFEMCGYSISCQDMAHKKDICEPVILNAKIITISTDATLSCSIRPFKWILTKFYKWRAQRELHWLLGIIAARKKEVMIDAIDLSIEHMSLILSCKTITKLKINKFTKELDDLLRGRNHIKSVHTYFNDKFPFLPAVDSLTIDATHIPNFFAEHIQQYVSIHTRCLTILLNFGRISPMALAQLSTFFKLNVPKIAIEIRFETAVAHLTAEPWEGEFVQDVLDLYQLVVASCKYTPSKQQIVSITFNWEKINAVYPINHKEHVAAQFHPYKLVNKDPNHYTFRIPIAGHKHCLFEVQLE